MRINAVLFALQLPLNKFAQNASWTPVLAATSSSLDSTIAQATMDVAATTAMELMSPYTRDELIAGQGPATHRTPTLNHTAITGVMTSVVLLVFGHHGDLHTAKHSIPALLVASASQSSRRR